MSKVQIYFEIRAKKLANPFFAHLLLCVCDHVFNGIPNICPNYCPAPVHMFSNYALIITLFGILNQFGKSCFAFANKTEGKKETASLLKDSIILWTILV